MGRGQADTRRGKGSALGLIAWLVLAGLGLTLHLAAWPLILKLVLFPAANADKPGLGVEVFAQTRPQGRPTRSFAASQTVLELEQEQTSLRALGLWRVQRPGIYRLLLSCDDAGELALDGRPLLALEGVSAANRGEARVRLEAGLHLVELTLVNLPGRGWLRLEAALGGEDPAVLGGEDLLRCDLGNLSGWLALAQALEDWGGALLLGLGSLGLLGWAWQGGWLGRGASWLARAWAWLGERAPAWRDSPLGRAALARPQRLARADLYGAAIPALVFLLGNLAYYLAADDWGIAFWDFNFPYDLSTLSVKEILLYFDRQPPLFLLFVKAMGLSPLPQGETLFLANLVMMTGLLLLLYFFLVRYVSRLGAVLLTTLAAMGYDVFVYAHSTGYEVFTAFFVFLLVALHVWGFKFFWGRRHNHLLLAAIPLAAVVLTLARSMYFYFLAPYAAYFFLSLLYAQRRVPALSRRRLTALLCLSVALFLLVPLAMLKNHIYFGHASLSSWGYTSFQRVVLDQLEHWGVSEPEVKEYIARAPGLSPQVKRFYELNAPWPINYADAAILYQNRPEAAQVVLEERPPDPSITSPLYMDLKNWNGYPIALLSRPGFEAAKEIFRERWGDMLPGIFIRTAPLALAHSTQWFMKKWGKNVQRWPDPWDLLTSPHLFVPDAETETWRRGTQGAISLGHFPFRALVPLELMLQIYGAPLLVLLAALHLVVLGLKFIRGQEADPGPLLLAALIVYSFLVSVYGESGENARFGFYWKLPLVAYAGLLLAGLGRLRRRRRRPPGRFEPR